MEKLRSIIIDDELGSINSLKWELENFKDKVEIVGFTQKGTDGLKMIRELKPDLVFLDIQMPGMNGFDIISKIEDNSIKVIFTTAHDEYALKAFEVSAFDYLVKPVTDEDLGRALNKIKTLDVDDLFIQVKSLLSKLQGQKQDKIIAMPTSEGVIFIDISNIIHCKADGNYTYIFIENEPTLFVSKTLKDVEKIIDNDQFCRVHQSHLINIRSMKKYLRGKAGSIVMKDGTTVPVSRNKKGDFLNH